MNKLWRTYAGRIDALSLRERAMVFIAAVAVPVFLLHLVYIEPAVTRKHALAVKMTQQQIELQALQIKLQGAEIVGVAVPAQLVQLIPYLATIVVLAGFVGQARAPKAIGRLFDESH